MVQRVYENWQDWANGYLGREVRENANGSRCRSEFIGKVERIELGFRKTGVVLFFKDADGIERSAYRQIPRNLRPQK